MQLFEDQQVFTHQVAVSLSKNRKSVGQLPTGGGKTFIFSNITARWISKQNTSVLIFVHREELLEQTRRTLYREFKIEVIPIVAGMKYIPPSKVYVGMVESAFKRLHKITNIGLVIIDECHIAVFNKIHEEFEEAKILGFSATPLAANKKKPLNLFYEDIVCGPQINELIKSGRLSQNITYGPKNVVNTDELKMKGNEFDEEMMAVQFRKPKHINSTIHQYRERGVGLKTMIFNVNLQHSRDVCEAFNQAGYKCKHLGSDTESERKDILKWLSETPNAIVCSVGMTTTGFDDPTIEHIIVNKATASVTLWLQMCGRGGRVIEGRKSSFFITDMGENWRRHGDWNQDRDWNDLFFYPAKANKPGVPPIKSCPECEAIVAAGAKHCDWCGYVFPIKPIAVEQIMKDFEVVTKDINVIDIINKNTDKREYYSLFEIGHRVAVCFKEKSLELNENTFNFALTTYQNIAKTWTRERKKKLNEFHRNLIKNTLIKELQILYPEWQVPAA